MVTREWFNVERRQIGSNAIVGTGDQLLRIDETPYFQVAEQQNPLYAIIDEEINYSNIAL